MSVAQIEEKLTENLSNPKLFRSELRSYSGLGQQCEPLTVPFEEVPGVTTL